MRGQSADRRWCGYAAPNRPDLAIGSISGAPEMTRPMTRAGRASRRSTAASLHRLEGPAQSTAPGRAFGRVFGFASARSGARSRIIGATRSADRPPHLTESPGGARALSPSRQPAPGGGSYCPRTEPRRRPSARGASSRPRAPHRPRPTVSLAPATAGSPQFSEAPRRSSHLIDAS
jgi:hypothetical protein